MLYFQNNKNRVYSKHNIKNKYEFCNCSISALGLASTLQNLSNYTKNLVSYLLTLIYLSMTHYIDVHENINSRSLSTYLNVKFEQYDYVRFFLYSFISPCTESSFDIVNECDNNCKHNYALCTQICFWKTFNLLVTWLLCFDHTSTVSYCLFDYFFQRNCSIRHKIQFHRTYGESSSFNRCKVKIKWWDTIPILRLGKGENINDAYMYHWKIWHREIAFKNN